MQTKNLFFGVAAVTTLLAGVATAQAQQAIRIGTSSTGSVFYTIAVGAGEVINKHAKVNTTVESVGGSTANVNGLKAKKVEFAVANAFAAFSGYFGQYKFKGRQVDLRLVLQAQTSNRYLVFRKGAGLKSFKDLEGQTVVAKRRALPELQLVFEAMMKAHGVDLAKINNVATSKTPATVKALRAGSVAAAMMPFSYKSGQVEKPARDGVIEFPEITKAKQEEILKALPSVFFGSTMPAKNFTGQTKPVHLFSLNTYFLVRPDVSDEVVYKVIKAISENTKELSTYHKSGRLWTAKRAAGNFALPFHNGAIKYLKEKGLWGAEQEAKQAKLLKR